jgi:hypothetical protein
MATLALFFEGNKNSEIFPNVHGNVAACNSSHNIQIAFRYSQEGNQEIRTIS